MEPNRTSENDTVREQPAAEADELKRDFIKRFGGLAATAPVAMFLLMSPKTSAAAGTDSAP